MSKITARKNDLFNAAVYRRLLTGLLTLTTLSYTTED